MKKFLILMTTLVALFVVSIPLISAQDDCPTTGTPISVTYTEAQINASFRVTNPVIRNFSSLYVDLQPGQVTITGNYTWRSSTGVRTDSFAASLTPTISNGRVYWSVISLMVDGQPASEDLITQINASLETAWRRWFEENGPAGRVTDITITDDDISYTYVRWAAGCVPAPITGTAEPVPSSGGASGASSVTVTYTEAQINSSFRVTNPVNRTISDEYVNLQPGQVTISATLTWRQRGGDQSADVAVTLTPSISNGRVNWDVVSITADGQPASASLVAQVNASLAASWHRWVSENAPAGVITDISISEDAISYTYIPRR